MKTIILVVCCLFVISLDSSKAADTYTVGWLRKGLTSIVVARSDPKNLTKDQDQQASVANDWITGFMSGINCGAAATMTTMNPLAYPPPEWNSVMIAPQILAYIEKVNVKEETPAGILVASWYMANHPKSDELQKALAAGILHEYLIEPTGDK